MRFLLILLALSCASEGNKGKVIGGTSGALVGASIGAIGTKSAGGALVGGLIGGAIGLGVGHAVDSKAKELKEKRLLDMKKTAEGRYEAVLRSDILFDHNSTTLKPSGQKTIGDIAKVLSDCGTCKIIFNGYTDSTGTLEYNKNLSQKRAEEVKRHFLFYAPSYQYRVLAYGQGISTSKSSASENRRVEMILYE